MEHSDAAKQVAQRALEFANRGDRESAIRLFREAIQLRPSFAVAHHNLGVALADSGKSHDAIASFREAIRLNPDYSDAYYNLGILLNQSGKSREALETLSVAHRLRPNHPETLNNLGLALIYQKRSDEAIVLLRHALRICPTLTAAYNNLGLAYADTGEYVKAEDCFEHALSIHPNAIESLNNLASLYRDWGKFARSLATYDLALTLDPQHISTRWNRSLCLLQMRRYSLGWAEYECRRNKPGQVILSFPQPYWDGGSLDGRTLLLHAEQGRGDAIQFIRFANLIPRTGRVVFFCPRDLADVLANAPGVDQMIVDGEPLPPFDVHASLMSLPALLGGVAPSADTPYLFPKNVLRPEWAAVLDDSRLKVGVAWQGNPQHSNDHHRSIRLREFGDLAQIPAIQLVSLQRGHGTEQIAEFKAKRPLLALEQDTDDRRAFGDLAALISSLSVVVTVDTAVAHLAGALGVETLVLISAHTDWRWHTHGVESDWYANVSIIRQKTLDDWEPVIAEVYRRLERRIPQSK
jgi:tetratricopeptide (TPR) repeat protein